MPGDALRNLRIKTGVVQRTAKELQSYRVELEDNRTKIEELRAGNDHSHLKQWVRRSTPFLFEDHENVMLETQNMIPDTASRLRVAMEDLELLLNDCSDLESSSTELTAAKQVVENASLALRGA